MEFKYLSDGKKVIVIGQLNNVESIVQEVFVTEGGDEIPSGEKFTTKSLHDEPVISWKEKDEAKQKVRLARAKDEIEQVEHELRDIRTKQKGLHEIFKQSRLLAENLKEQDFDTLVSVMSGTCKYLTINNYGSWELVKFEDRILQIDNFYGRDTYEGIKLISLMGSSDGSLSYRLNQYKDGSGSYTRVFPFSNKVDALAMIGDSIKAKIEDGKVPSIAEYKKLKEIGVSFNTTTTRQIRLHILNAFATNDNTAKKNYEEYLVKARAAAQEAKNLF